MLTTTTAGGITVYKVDDKFHRPNGPAWYNHNANIWTWWLHGERHRYYGPRDWSGDWRIHDEYITRLHD